MMHARYLLDIIDDTCQVNSTYCSISSNILRRCKFVLRILIILVIAEIIISQPALSGWDNNYWPRCIGTGEYCVSNDIVTFYVYFVPDGLGGYDIKCDILWSANSPRKYVFAVFDVVKTLGGTTIPVPGFTDKQTCFGYLKPDANGWSRGLILGSITAYEAGYTYTFQNGLFYWDTPASSYVSGCGSKCDDYSSSKCRKDVSATIFPPLEVSGVSQTTCVGGTSQITLTVSGGSGSYSYSWSDTIPSTLSCTTCKNPIATPTTIGVQSYHVVVTDTATLLVKEADVTVTTLAKPVATVEVLIE